ncbi:MAG: oligopeptide transporter, OPT family [Gammaproteobacteria bacterium]
MTDHTKHIPFVPAETSLAELTIRALVIGLVMAVVLGAANIYLGLKAGMTIAATFPAAVVGMALLKIMKGSILEENLSRTIASSGYCIASGSIFILPAFYIAGIWTTFGTWSNYFISVIIMAAGGILGILFVTMIRKMMVEDKDLVFPESLAASEIHKAGRREGANAKYLFHAMGVGAIIQALGQLSLFASSWQKFVSFAKASVNLKSAGTAVTQGGIALSAPAISPAFIGVGYIIGPKLISLIFGGGLLAWGLFVPLMLYFLAPEIINQWQHLNAAAVGQIPAESDWIAWATMIWKFIVRPIAIGMMLTSAGLTLFRMRKSLAIGLKRAFGDIGHGTATDKHIERTDRDLNFKWVVIGILGMSIFTGCLYYYFTQSLLATLLATLVMIVIGFVLTAISGYLIGIVGSSNNPVSGLTLIALIIAALLMVFLGISGKAGIAATLGIAAVICISTCVSGDMIQDLKVGYILGGTPWRMQLGDILGVIISAAIMFLPLVLLNQADINAGKLALHPYEGGFGSINLAAPQAGLMAYLAQGIIGGAMAWPLVIVGMIMGLGLILLQVRSPMLVSIGMYLPIGTTFAMFVGAAIKALAEKIYQKKNFNDAQKTHAENIGVLVASGLIAGEALIGLVFAAFAFFNIPMPMIFKNPTFAVTLLVFAFLAWYLVRIPTKHAGSKNQEALPPLAM